MDWGVASTLLVLNICVMRISSQNDNGRPPVFNGDGMLDKVFVSRGRVELECQATGQPPPRYIWLKNGESLVIEADGRLNQSEGNLRISNMESSDAGLYQCYAENEFGGALSRTYSLIEAMVKYKSTSHIRYINVTEGDPLSIMIAHPYESIPKPVHIWEMISNEKATQITPDKRIQIDDRGNLHFAYITREDGSIGEDYYKHTLFNPMLDMKAGGSYTRVIVKSVPGGMKRSPPAITPSSVSSVIAVEQQNVSFRCIFSGNPEPKVTWTGPRVSTLSDFETKLTIYRVQSTDEGTYVCKGENSEGSTKAEVHLKVEAAPVFRSTRDSPHDVTVTEGSDHTFNCDTYAKPEATVEWYMNGVRINAEAPPSRIKMTGNKRRLTIQRVCRSCDDGRKSDAVNIQCNASNVHGFDHVCCGEGSLDSSVSSGSGDDGICIRHNLDDNPGQNQIQNTTDYPGFAANRSNRDGRWRYICKQSDGFRPAFRTEFPTESFTRRGWYRVHNSELQKSRYECGNELQSIQKSSTHGCSEVTNIEQYPGYVIRFGGPYSHTAPDRTDVF